MATRFSIHSGERTSLRAVFGQLLAWCCLLAAVSFFSGCASPYAKTTRYSYEPAYGVEDPQFLRSMQALRTGIRPGNRAVLLENGDGVFGDMFEQLRLAKKSINIEVYIYDSGEIGGKLADILCERAQAGVEVRVLVDDLGARLGKMVQRLRAAGVQFREYKPVRLYSLNRIEHRTHRKLVIIDGKTSFCGGFGFDDRWKGDARNRDEWRDVAVRLEGPVTTQMQMIFLEDWMHTTGEVLHGDSQFPAADMPGDKLAQAVSSSRGDQASTSKLMVYMAIQAARKRIWIANAYFVPDSQIRTALIKAAKRGVDVRVIVPGAYIDFPPTLHASRYYQGDLLAGGVKVYEYQPTMMHSKVMVVDSLWSSIGSINLNARSFKKQAEANVVIYDYAFAAEVESMLQKDLAQSREITMTEYRQRGVYAHWREFWYSLFSENY